MPEYHHDDRYLQVSANSLHWSLGRQCVDCKDEEEFSVVRHYVLEARLRSLLENIGAEIPKVERGESAIWVPSMLDGGAVACYRERS